MAINFWYGLWYIIAVSFAGQFFNWSWHYGDHYGSEHHRGDVTRDSVSIYSRWYNFLTFRNGYHQEHHHSPGVHWTKFHEITPLLPEDRTVINDYHTGHLNNVPFFKDLKLLFKL